MTRPGLPSTYQAGAGGHPVAWEMVYQRVQSGGVNGNIKSVPVWVPRTITEIQAMAKTRPLQVTRPVQALANGMTYHDQRDLLSDAIKAAFAPGKDEYAWLSDFDDTTVVFEVEADFEGKQIADYSIDANGVVTIGEASPVKTQYVPVAAPTIAPSPDDNGDTVAANAGCGCRKPGRIRAEAGDIDTLVADLEARITDLESAVAKLEAENVEVDAVTNLPDGGDDVPADQTS